jgi:hypothetical protein
MFELIRLISIYSWTEMQQNFFHTAEWHVFSLTWLPRAPPPPLSATPVLRPPDCRVR